MNEAAPQAAAGETDIAQALEVLRLAWRQWYRIGYDDVREWWAQRRDDLSCDITAECKICHGQIRLDQLMRMEWRHVLAEMVTPASPAGDTA